MTTPAITTKIIKLQSQLNQGLVGRDEVIKATLLTLLAGENIVLLGPPGTGKSLLSRRISQAFAQADNHHFFEYLLTKFSTPEEIFGPLSLSQLKQDRFVRNTTGYLPTVQIAFLDEIFKASSSILNALLTILNERVFHNGTDSQATPLQGLIGASNELPNGDDDLSALYDRFLVRKFVDYLASGDRNALFDLPPKQDIDNKDKLTVAELAEIKEQAKAVIFPSEIRQAIEQIWQKHADTFKEDSSEQLSDRRLVKALDVLRVSAVTNGRSEVDLSDVMLLKDMLWNNPNNAQQVLNVVLERLQKFDQQIEIDNNEHDQQAKSIDKPVIISPKGTTIKGMQGKGTLEDPILINDLQDFARLQDPNVGQQGFYFRQTAHLDFTPISKNSWFKSKFIGHYDGNNHKFYKKDSTDLIFFEEIENSSISRVKIVGILLAQEISNSEISHSDSSETLCIDAEKITIQSCYVNSALVASSIKNSTVNDCTIHFDKSITEGFEHDEIQTTEYAIAQVCENTTIANCYISGEMIDSHTDFVFIKNSCKDSHIKNCLVASTLQNLIVVDFEDSTFTNNKYITNPNHELHEETTSNGYMIYPQGICNPVSDVLISQSYFENTLGWDFESIWEWNDDTNEPQLQAKINVQEYYSKVKGEQKESLLYKQINNNVWL